jgi:membrane protein DedA with SNARE-associated domain
MSQHGGMGLGEVLLSSIAGAMIGSWIGSKLFGNQNFQNNRKAGYKSPSTYNRSKKSFNKPKRSASSKKGGFFGGKKSSSRSGGFFGG